MRVSVHPFRLSIGVRSNTPITRDESNGLLLICRLLPHAKLPYLIDGVAAMKVSNSCVSPASG